MWMNEREYFIGGGASWVKSDREVSVGATPYDLIRLTACIPPHRIHCPY
jgi:hypothetical protein